MSAILPSFNVCCDTEFCVAPVTVSVPGPPGAAGPPGASADALVGWFVKKTLADARLVPVAATNAFMVMLGGLLEGDGFGALFYWDALSNDVDNYTEFGGTTLNPAFNSGAGRWKRYL